MKRTAITIVAAALLTLGLATPAAAAPPGYYVNASAALPTCKQIANAPALRSSVSTFQSLGDLSDPLRGTGYGTQLSSGYAIIDDGGHSCTFSLLGTKKTFTVSVAPISPYDRGRIQSLYSSTFGSTGTSIGGSNLVFGGYTGTVHEVGFLLEDGVWLTGKVTDNGDYFPAVLQDVSDTIYALNH